MPEPERALREMRRVLRPGGRLAAAVWGEQVNCGWASVFEIVDAQVRSEVCPRFFRMGQSDALARAVAEAGFEAIEQRRVAAVLDYASADEAFDAAFIGGPVALAWSRFDQRVRARVRQRYADAIEPWREGSAYRIPGEFVIVSARAPNPVLGQILPSPLTFSA
jgi:SAM-dependent methyltransferase